jgi:site-specific recombinase XerC
MLLVGSARAGPFFCGDYPCRPARGAFYAFQFTSRTLQRGRLHPLPENIGEKGPVSAPTEQNNYTVRLKRKAGTDAPKGLSATQLDAFFGAIGDKRDAAMFRVMYTKGLRASEVGLLDMRDWDDRGAVLYVHRLKGSRSAPFPMHDKELRALRAWLKVRGAAAGPIFLSRNHRPISRIRIFELMRKYCRLAGVPTWLAHPHALKHSRGSHLLEETGKVHVVQDALGHKNIANTMIYSQVSNRDRNEAVALNRSRY